jgi:hypothetical protein
LVIYTALILSLVAFKKCSISYVLFLHAFTSYWFIKFMSFAQPWIRSKPRRSVALGRVNMLLFTQIS